MQLKDTQSKRIFFLDYLRGLAVLLVMWGHIFLVGINDPNTVGIWIPTVKGFIFGEQSIRQNIHGQLGTFFALKTGITSGPLGVSIFFLISGFVILKTIDQVSAPYFLVRRFFRIIPLCGFVVFMTAFFTWTFCAIKGVTHPNSISSILTSTFALNYFNHAFVTIPVLWTLEVEMAFYLFIATTASIFRQIDFKVIIIMATFCVLTTFLIGTSLVSKIVSPVNLDRLIHIGGLLVHINFMLIGSVIYRGFSIKNNAKTIFPGLIVFVLYLFCFNIYSYVSNGRNIGVNLPDIFFALTIFIVAFLAGSRSPKLNSLQWIGKISYPLYLVHVPLGWGILSILGGYSWNMNLAALISVLFVTFIAWLLHINIELPTHKMGKKAAHYMHLDTCRVER